VLCCDASKRLQPTAEIVHRASGVPDVVERAGVEAVGSDLNGECDEFWRNRREKTRSGAQSQPKVLRAA
jgi:hypothetical protein